MVEKDNKEIARLSKRTGKKVTGRQMAPEVYSMNASIYGWHFETLGQGLWQENTRLYEMPRERSIDIDSWVDFKLVEMLLKEGAI